jgi:cell division GTPase FtsZ
MSMTIMGIGVGEGGGRLAMSMSALGTNIGAINTNKGDLAGLPEIAESKKLLLNISAGGSGRDPNFVREAMKNDEVKESVTAFMKKILLSTPLFSKCTHCGSSDQILDKEHIGDTHTCSFCQKEFGITELAQNPNIKHDYIFLFVCLGGGSGSGLIVDVVDICLKNFNLPIGVVCTLPGDTEDMITKNNAISIFTELHSLYAKAG